MKTRTIFAIFGWLAAGLVGLGATADQYVNDDSISTPPQVDARVFLNRGTMNFNGLTLPFDTQNTLYFTNTGTMAGKGYINSATLEYDSLGGFRLDHTDGINGTRIPASVINNLQGATIDGEPFLSLSATNVINRGLLQSAVAGLIRINGQNVDLANSRLDLGTVSDKLYDQSGRQSRTNFTPMRAVYDSTWGTNIVDLDLAEFFKYATNGSTVTTPGYIVDPLPFPDSMSLSAPLIFVHTNSFGPKKAPTNQIIEVVFVANNNTNVSVDVSFLPSSEQSNPFNTLVTKFSGYETNVVTRQRVSRSLFLTDRLASATNLLVAADTNLFLLTNSTTLSTFRPANFRIERSGNSGAAANALISSNTFTQFVSPQFTNGMSYSNAAVTPFFSAYEAYVDSNVQLTNNNYAALTNYAGRLEINADNLNLSNTRLRAAGAAFIKAKNLIGSAGLAADVPKLYYELGATNGNLVLQGLAGTQITRFASGDIKAWSAIWTNGFDQTTTNSTIDPSSGATNSEVVTTNFTTMFHVLLVSASLTSDDGVTSVSGLKGVATNTTVADQLLIDSSIELNTDNLTVNGTLLVGSTGSGFWNAASAPGLRRLTNNGILAVQGVANFGMDRLFYDTFVNTGTNEALSMSIGATSLYSSGTILTITGPLDIAATSMQLNGSASKTTAAGDLYLAASDLKMQGATLSAGRTVQMQISNSLLDGGAGAPNRVVSVQGFTLNSKPAFATLLGTTFEVNVVADGSGDILWPGADLGANKDGFANNAAIGRLRLNSDVNGLVTFAGINGGKALYVDFLEFSSLISADLNSFMEIADDFTIYFADSNIPAEQLDGALSGHLKWVRNFAGPYSGIDVALASGRTIRVNRNLFNSQLIDSDSDGIANAFDPEPFGGVPISTTLVNVPPQTTEITWTAAPQTTYRVERTGSLSPTVWELVTTVSNTSIEPAQLTARDPLNPGQAVRYYRVTYEP
jgi:hypothetical protein